MKFKTYLIILLVVGMLLFYNVCCYLFANKIIDERTKGQITNYFNNLNKEKDFQYEYIKATLNDNQTINVFIKARNLYYRVIFDTNGGYRLIEVNQDIPIYIR